MGSDRTVLAAAVVVCWHSIAQNTTTTASSTFCGSPGQLCGSVGQNGCSLQCSAQPLSLTHLLFFCSKTVDPVVRWRREKRSASVWLISKGDSFIISKRVAVQSLSSLSTRLTWRENGRGQRSKVMVKGSFTQLMTSTVFVLTDLADLNFDSVCFSIQAFNILRKK